jgi:hypothetical protein
MRYGMKTYGGVDVYTNVFLTSALVGGGWSASRFGHFALGEMTPGTHWRGRLGGLHSRSGRHGEVQILAPPGLELRPLAIQLVASRYTYCSIPALTL